MCELCKQVFINSSCLLSPETMSQTVCSISYVSKTVSATATLVEVGNKNIRYGPANPQVVFEKECSKEDMNVCSPVEGYDKERYGHTTGQNKIQNIKMFDAIFRILAKV